MSLRIAVVASWFSDQTGYAENCLSKALASLGHEVHVITSTAQPYFDEPFYDEVYAPWLGPPVVEPGVTEVDGYRVHRLPMTAAGGSEGIRMRGMLSALRGLRPDVVQGFEAVGFTAHRAAVGKPLLGYKLFTGNHLHASVFPAAKRSGARARPFSRQALQGRLVGRMCERCYAISTDAAEIAVRFLAFPPEKVVVSPLGTDTEVFRPLGDRESLAARRALREELGVADDEIVCIYTGRFTVGDHGKNPLCLADAVARLVAEGHPYRALFVGGGDPAYVEEISSRPGSIVRPFVGFRELARHYWAGDVGVWPRQESTSQIDAAATGLPLVLSDTVQVRERVDGSGLTYREDDVEDLARQLLRLADPSLRRRLGDAGAERMQRDYSWRKLAEQRLADYQRSLDGR